MALEKGPQQNPEKGTFGVINTVPLRTLIRLADVASQRSGTYSEAADRSEPDPQKLNDYLIESMIDDAFLSHYVINQTKKALTPSEALLIAQTAVVTHYVISAARPPVDSTLAERMRSKPSLPSDFTTEMEYEIKDKTKNLNSIYSILQQDMWRHPELAVFIAGKMSQSVSLEEGNLIGLTALTVYKADCKSLSTHDREIDVI